MYPTTAAASAPVPKPTMASRRRSVMPPPAAAPKIAKAPVAKVATKTTASSRAKAVTAAPKTKPAPAPRTGTSKRAATAKTVRVAEKATEFVSADAFDFGRPDDLDDSITSVASSIDTEVTLKLPDIAGPMTRARRRTSVFAPSRNSFVPPLRTPVKPPVEIKQVLEEPETEETATVEAPPVTSTAIKSTGGDSGKGKQGQAPPDLKLSGPLTPIVELKRMPSGEYRDSPARRKTVQKSQKKLKKADDKENDEAQAGKKSPLSAIPLNLTPLKSTKKKVQKQSVFLGTPKAVDPMNVLKKNLRQKVDKNLDDKVAGLPENSSPYAMLSGETENGTPVERFVKIQKPTAEIAAKFVTGTPAPSLAQPPRSTRRGTASKRHLAMSQVKAVAGGSAASDIAEDQEEMVLERDGSPKLPKRNRSSVFNGFPTPVASAKRRLSDQGNPSNLEEESDENAPPATSTPLASPPKSSQLVTGDLVRACAIM